MKLLISLNKWFESLLRIDAYEMTGNEIISKRFPRRIIRSEEIQTWRPMYIGGGLPFICIQLTDGRTFDWSDKSEQLMHILQKVVPDKEQPFIHF